MNVLWNSWWKLLWVCKPVCQSHRETTVNAVTGEGGVCVYIWHAHVCVEDAWLGATICCLHSQGLTLDNRQQQKRKQRVSKKSNGLVKMNRCTQQISLTLIIEFIMLSCQLCYRSYSPLACTQEKRPDISWPMLIKTIACKFKAAHVTKLLLQKHCLQLRSPELTALKLTWTFKHTADIDINASLELVDLLLCSDQQFWCRPPVLLFEETGVRQEMT